MKAHFRRLVDLWSEAIWLDYLLPLAAVGVHVSLLLTGWSRAVPLKWPEPVQRSAVYSTAATTVAVIGGLSAIGVSVYLASGGERATAVRRIKGSALRRNWRSLLTGMGVSAVLCIAAQSLDRSGGPLLVTAWAIFEFAMSLALMRFGRLLWLFDAIMRVADQDVADQEPEPAPKLRSSWWHRAAG